MRKKSKPNQAKQKNNILRQPRPLGLTLLAQQTRNQPITNQLISQILNYILSTNIEVRGKRLNLHNLSIYLNISLNQVMKAYLDYQGQLSRVMLGNVENVKGALLFSAMEKNLENEAYCHDQLRLLQASQGGTYKAFISSSVNDAIGLKMQSSKALMDMYKMLNPSGPSIAIQHNHNQPVGAIKSVGQTEALQILQKEGLLAINYDPTYNAKLIGTHNLDKAPEVRATHQATSTTDGVTLLTGPANINNHHKTRRSKEEGLDEETFI